MSDKIFGNTKLEQLLDPVNATSTRTSSSIDTIGFNERLVVANIGFSLDSLSGSKYWTVQLEESDNASTFTDVADADTNNGAGQYVLNSSSLDQQAYIFSYKGEKRYLRMTITNTGTHSVGTPMGVVAILGTPAVAPVA